MKDNINLFLVILIIVGIIVAMFKGAEQADINSKLRKKEKLDFIEECLESGRRVDEVGSFFTGGGYLVCNPT